ncbi:methyltransferase domain-containing protein [Alteromonas sp. S167]|uniref:methyltransferase domain-containing protein n=1 Tax=Alteromonas sp. S167 TaxID=3117402 RepID=UPI002FE2056C
MTVIANNACYKSANTDSSVNTGTTEQYSVKACTLVTSEASASAINEQAVATRFSKAAGQYDSIANIQKRIAQQCLSYLPQNLKGSALDIGCGTGMHTHTLSVRGANAIGVDIAQGMLDVAANSFNNVKFVNASAQALPFEADSFQTVFSSMALQWSSSPVLVAEQIQRVLSKNGIAELAIMVSGSFTELQNARKVAQLPQANTPMPSTSDWVSAFRKSSLSLSRVITKDYVDTHSSLMQLLHSVKGVGAGETGSKQPSLSRRDIKKLAMAYQNTSGVDGELPLTYRVSHFRLEKR